MFHEPNVFNGNGQLNGGDFVLKRRDCVRECEREWEGEVSSRTDEHDVIGASQTEKDGRDLHEDNYRLSPQNVLRETA